MAISKERLEELIQQNAIIWHDDWEEIKLDKNTCEVCEVKTFSGKHLYWCLDFEYEWNNEKHHTQCNLDELEEDVEKGRWEQEFKRIPRTDYLDLPTWEEFNKSSKLVRFRDKEGNRCRIEGYCDDTGNGFIDVVVGIHGIFTEDYTKENYTLACRKAKELFLGGKENDT